MRTWDNTSIVKNITGQAVFSNGALLLNTGDKKLHYLITSNTGTCSPTCTSGNFCVNGTCQAQDSTLATLAGQGTTPLLGSDGRIYTASGTNLTAVNIVANATVSQTVGSSSWSFALGGNSNFTAAPTMDCNGVLYAAAGSSVYALITDAQGLANTPWPKYQRDSRNSGNADAPTLWGVRSAAGCVQ